jgi:hypothetical protein
MHINKKIKYIKGPVTHDGGTVEKYLIREFSAGHIKEGMSRNPCAEGHH